MQIRTRDGKEFDSKPLKSQKFLYKTILGRLILKALIRPSFSKKIGKKLDSPKSLKKAYKFARKNNINLDDFILDDINSFNDFSQEKLKMEEELLILFLHILFLHAILRPLLIRLIMI